jgi:hypothetical protein
VKAWRIIFAASGVLVALYGMVMLVLKVPAGNLLWVVVWLVALVLIHDGILAPAIVGLGWGLRRSVPDRGRRYLQTALIAAAMITVISVPMILLRGSQPPAKALLLQNYGLHLLLLLGLIGIVTLVAYAVRIARDRAQPDDTRESQRVS